jgi:glycosyltransferase involved in cell wall biosynthesis
VHLTALVEGPEHVCCRYRVAAYRPYLERAGHSLDLRPRPQSWCDWFRAARELRDSDTILLQRRLLQRWQLWLIRRAARRLLFDFDDAVFLRDSYASRGFHSAGRLRRFAATVRAADTVIAGNDYLAAQAARLACPARVHVIPTCVDPRRYPSATHSDDASTARAGGVVRLVWVGSSSTLQGLEAIRPLLEHLGQGIPGLQLKLICDRFQRFENLPVIPCPWTESGEGAEIAAADIGISWVPDDPWSRGKCGLKVLQYMAAGLPVVANPVGVHAEMIRHGENGFLVETPAEWADAVRELARRPALRRCLGEAGRRRVERDYSVAAGARRWLDLLGKLGARRGVA